MANTNETYAARIQRKLMKKQYLVEVATGRRKADLVLKNASYVNVFSNELCHGDIAVAKGQIVGMGDYAGEVEYDVSGKIVCPGFIDAHIHLESSLVSPREFVRAVLPHGTTTVITDPHEITNVMGTDGIDFCVRQQRLYAAGIGGPAHRRAFPAAELRALHAAGRVRREPRLPRHRLIL